MVRELVNVYKADVFQKSKVHVSHALVTVHYNLSYRTTYVHRQTFCAGMYSIPPNNVIDSMHSKTEFIACESRDHCDIPETVCNVILHGGPILLSAIVHLHKPP